MASNSQGTNDMEEGRDRLEIIADLVAARKQIYDMELAQRTYDADQYNHGYEDALEDAAKICIDLACKSEPDDFALDALVETEHAILALKLSSATPRKRGPKGTR